MYDFLLNAVDGQTCTSISKTIDDSYCQRNIPPPSREAVFDRLRPICVQLTKEHTRENIEILAKDVEDIDKKSVHSDELYTDLYKCMEIILSKSRISKWEMFQDIFNTSCIMLSPPANQGKDIPEELKLAIVKNLTALVKNSDFSIIRNLYSVPSLPVLGHSMSVILNLAENEWSRSLKIAAMNCLLELGQVKVMLGDTFASFLPGVSISLSHIITGDSKQGQNVISTAINVLTRIIQLVLDDNLIKESQAKDFNIQQVQPDERLQKLIIKRNEQWIQNTDEKMSILMKQLVSLRSHSSWKVRLSLIEMAGVMLQHCYKSLKSCVSLFLEVLVGLVSDEYPNVAARSRTILEMFSQTHMETDCKPLVEILEENLHNLTTSLPRQMRTTDEEQKLSVINLLSGPNVNSLFMSSSHLKRLTLSLIQILEFDCSDIKIIEERTQITGHGSSAVQNSPGLTRPRKYFKLFHDPRIIQELKFICQMLGYYGNLNLLIDHFLDIFQQTSLHRMQATFIINEIMLGTIGLEPLKLNKTMEKKYKTEDLENVISMLIEEYLSPSNFDLITSPVNEDDDLSPESQLKTFTLMLTDAEQNISIFNKNTLQICLFLEGFGVFAKVLEERFIPFLIHTLYPLLEKLGDQKAFISNTAYLSLCDIYTACHYKSLDELIKKNVDYLVNAVSLRLRHFTDNRRSPTVLKVILQYSNSEILPFIDDTIQEVLSSLDNYYSQEASLFMGVLNELTKAVGETSSQNEDKLSQNEDKPNESVQDLKDFMIEYHKQKQIADGIIDEDDSLNYNDLKKGEAQIENDDDDDLKENDDKKEQPQHILIVKQIMLRSKHLMSSKNPRLRLMVLDTIANACLALTDSQGSRSIISNGRCKWRLYKAKDSERCHTKIDQLLGKTISNKYTILSHVGNICQKIGLEENNLNKVLESCVIYLNSRQPSPLQQLAVTTCCQMAQLEPDTVWLMLCDLYCPIYYTVPSSAFRQIKLKILRS
ncbi:hypothetical protein KUTeg_001803 [Tegillarca granosa]|uniref:Uncharacterized protein n=1 Tax=Tegillarca granosa TaxID=220873 RepID=A0ABQ9FVN4_TEGGR|nr:hypothetical protein KUTeg_001803 [Tegillarca granosa]